MACHSAILIFLLFAIVPISTLAREFIVGDDSGWTTNFDYQAWAQGKTFRVGDKLVFQYPAGAHNVFRVNGTGFQNCIKPPLDQAMTTGNDTIVLVTPGNKWYICGVGKHCESAGQKLKITVLPYSPTPSPSAAPPPYGVPYKPGTPLPSPSMAPGSGSDTDSEEYDETLAPAPSPADLGKWEYGTPAPAPVEEVPWEYGTPAPSPIEEVTWKYGTLAPSPDEEEPWEYGTPAPSPIEEVTWKYGTLAPSPDEEEPWEYGTPGPSPVESVPWGYDAPAPSPDAGTGYTAKKRPFINFL